MGIDYKRGMAAHKGGMNSCFAIHMLNLLVGAVDVPGGQRGVNPIGPYWTAGMSSDGLIIPSDFIAKYNKPYPGRKASIPQTLDLQELFPVALFTLEMSKAEVTQRMMCSEAKVESQRLRSGRLAQGV